MEILHEGSMGVRLNEMMGNLVVVVCLDIVVLCESTLLYYHMRKPFLLFLELYVS